MSALSQYLRIDDELDVLCIGEHGVLTGDFLRDPGAVSRMLHPPDKRDPEEERELTVLRDLYVGAQLCGGGAGVTRDDDEMRRRARFMYRFADILISVREEVL